MTVGYYDGVLFHRVVPGFIAQTGDPSGTGKGGECIYDEGSFEDEFNARLKFSRRGLVGKLRGIKDSLVLYTDAVDVQQWRI